METNETLTVPVTLDALPRVREYVAQAAERADLDHERCYRLVLAVDEVVSNTIVHGYADDPPPDGAAVITVSTETTPRDLVVTIDDQAAPFDPRQTPIPKPADLEVDAADRKIGGLGLYLARTGVDRFDYEWIQGHNRTMLTMQRARKGKTA